MSSVALGNAQAPFVLVFDIGTSSLHAMVYDAQAREVEDLITRHPYHAETTEDGGVQLDAAMILSAFSNAMDEIIARLDERVKIDAVATSCLAYNILGIDEAGKVLTPAYLYSDTRNAAAVQQLRAAYDWQPIYARTGCPLHTGYLPARFLWLRATQPEIFERAVHWLSLHEYILLELFGRAALSHSFASWSGMFNHATLTWDDEVLAISGVRADQLSTPRSARYSLQGLKAQYAERWKTFADTPFFPAIGDGALANLGSGCVDATRVAVTVGTSAAMRVVLPPEKATIPKGLWLYRVDERRGLLGGSLSNGGNVATYFSRLLQIGEYSTFEDELAAMPPDSHGLTLLPFFAGERSPGYRGDARAALVGWHLETKAVDLWRAAIESIAYRLGLIYNLLRTDMAEPREIIASGAALLNSRVWVQILADVLDAPVTASGEDEASARGAALMALKALHVIHDASELPAATGITYAPNHANHEIYLAAMERQKQLYHLLLDNKT